MEIGRHANKSDKTNKNKKFQLQREIGEIRINHFTKKNKG